MKPCDLAEGSTRPPLDVLHRFGERRRPHYLDYGTRHWRPGEVDATMSVGQPWDAFLAEVYAGGGRLLELDDDERVVAVYQRG